MKAWARLLVALMLFPTVAMAAEPIVGRASVIDGDTIEIQGERIRFNGVDAPESWQKCRNAHGIEYRCGKVAADVLDAFLTKSRPTSCEYVNRDRYGRFVGICRRADGSDVATWLVRTGNALDWPRYSKGLYKPAQDAAKAEHAGMWQGEFVKPWKAREQHRQ